jgi:hypothetical protein
MDAWPDAEADRPLTTVVVALGDPVAREEFSLRSELVLARSSVLYADRVVLFSPWTDLARKAFEFRQRIGGPEIWGALADEPELRARISSSPDVAGVLGQIASIVAGQRTDSDRDIAELDTAALAGHVEHATLMHDGDGVDDGFLVRLVDQLLTLLQDPSVHAVFDARAGDLVRSLVDADPRFSALDIGKRSREAELGAGLIARLPTFPTAPIDELVDLKRDLVGPLVRYRAAVAELEEGMSQVLGSAEIDGEIQEAWRRRVAPALVEIQDGLTEHTLVRELAKSGATSARDLIISGSALFMAMSTVGQIAVTASAAASVGGMTAHAALNAGLEHVKSRRAASSHDFYYLHRLAQVDAPG